MPATADADRSSLPRAIGLCVPLSLTFITIVTKRLARQYLPATPIDPATRRENGGVDL